MFYSPELFAMTAKSIAMLANDRVYTIARAMASDLDVDYTAEVTGAALALMPHIVEKAILTSPSLTGELAAELAKMFVDEFETLTKIQCTIGGSQNSAQKVIFKLSFHTLWKRQYKEIKPKVDDVWRMARAEQVDPIPLLALAVAMRFAGFSGVKLVRAPSLVKTEDALRSAFLEVHSRIDGA